MKPLFIVTIISIVFCYANAQLESTTTLSDDSDLGSSQLSESPQTPSTTQQTHSSTTKGVGAASISVFALLFAFILTIINL